MRDKDSEGKMGNVEEIDEIEGDWLRAPNEKKSTRVGNEYQALIPQFEPPKQPSKGRTNANRDGGDNEVCNKDEEKG